MQKTLLSTFFHAAVILALFVSGVYASGPSTLYKQNNIDIARANIEHYAWARDMVTGWKAGQEFTLTRMNGFSMT